MGLINKVTNHYLRILPNSLNIDNGYAVAFVKTYENIHEREKEMDREFKIYVFRNKLKDYLSTIYIEKYYENESLFQQLWELLSELLDDLDKPFSHKVFIGNQLYQPIIALGSQAYDICKTLGLEDAWLTDPVRIISEDRSVLGPQKLICPIVHDNVVTDDLSIIYPNLIKYWTECEKTAPETGVLYLYQEGIE